MTTQVTVWTLAWDTRSGTNCKVFATEQELDSHIEQIMREDIASAVGEEADEIRTLLDSGRIWDAWESWSEIFKDTLDTYHWDSQPLEIAVA